VVRYDNYLSSRLHVCAGVRQGGVLSPVLFSVFMNSLVIKLRAYRKAGLGAHEGLVYVGCLLYADDIMLISHSVEVMQRMLELIYVQRSQPVGILCLIRANLLSCGLALGLNGLVLR